MSEIKKSTQPSHPTITGTQANSAEKTAETSKALGTTKSPALTTTQVPAESKKIELKGEISLPKPTEEPNPTGAAKSIKNLAQEQGRTVPINGHNAQALVNMGNKLGDNKWTPEQLNKMGEMCAARTPEERKQSLYEALSQNCIESEGKFTQEFIDCYCNPGTALEKASSSDPKENQKTFSIFELMLLLNQLSNTQRDMAAKGMQLEQVNIEARFTEKIETTKGKAWQQFGLTIGVSLSSMVVGLFAVGTSSEATKQMIGMISQQVGNIGQALTTVHISTTFDVKLSEVEKEQSRNTFNQQTFRTFNEANAQQQDANQNAANELARTAAQSTATVARNI